MTRSAIIWPATVLLAIAGVAGCSSSETPAPSGSPSSPVITQPATEPVVLEYGDASATIAVGQAIDFNVGSEFEVDAPQVDEWTIKSDDPDIVSVTPGSSGATTTNPGGLGVKAGNTEVQLSIPGKIWNVRVTVTG